MPDTQSQASPEAEFVPPPADRLAEAAAVIRDAAKALKAGGATPENFRAAMLRIAGELDLIAIDIDWRSVDAPPAPHPLGGHCAVSVIGVVDDPALRINGDEPFVDVVAWWPDRKVWTVTHQCRADLAADDYEVRVVAWRPMLELPARGSVWQ